MNEFDRPVSDTPAVDTSVAAGAVPVVTVAESLPLPVDPVRSAAGRLGGQRVHKLAVLGREYEKEHGLKPGRQRLRQLIQLGKKYEAEHGLRIATPRRRKKVDAWQEFLAALSRVVKPAYRPTVEQLAAALRPGPATTVADPVTDAA